MPENMKNLGLRASEELWRKMSQLALDRNTSVQRLFEQAMEEAYFSGKDNKKPAPSPEDEALTDLRAYMAIVDKTPAERPFFDALRTNIKVFLSQA